MTDPRRLADVGSPFQQALIRSARRDHGSHSAEARCIVAASTIAATTAHASGAAAANAAAANIANAALGTSAGAGFGAAASAGVGAATAAASASFVAKAVAVGLALGLSVQGAAVVHRHLSKPTTQSSTPVTRALVETQIGAAPGESASRVQPRGVAEAAPSAAPAVTTTATPTAAINDAPRAAETAPLVVRTPSPSAQRDQDRVAPESGHETHEVSASTRSADPTSVARVAPSDTLEREVALIDEARLAYRANDYALALSLLDRHQQQFAKGSLGPEALVIRVQALVGLGRRAEAERLAQPYLANYGSSPVTQRLRSILGK